MCLCVFVCVCVCGVSNIKLVKCKNGICLCVPVSVYVSVCHGILMSVHGALQITSEKLAILDCNHFIKSTMN